jgi:hypothetical protein
MSDKVIVNMTTKNIYSFCEGDEQLALEKALENNKQDLERAIEYNKLYNDEYWKEREKHYKKVKFKIMEYEEFLKLEREHYLNKPIKKITSEKFNEMLDILPPLKWVTINGVNEFLMSEFETGSYTSQYARKNEKYYTKIVDARDKVTWIHNFI